MEGEGEGRIREEGGRQWERGGKRARAAAGLGVENDGVFYFCFALLSSFFVVVWAKTNP